MNNLILIQGNTYYIDTYVKVGVYKISDNEAWLIDSGSDADAAKSIIKTLKSYNIVVKGILNTHFHADHIGGNYTLQKEYGCTILAPDIECMYVKNTYLNPDTMYGGQAFKELYNKLFYAKPSNCQCITDSNMPKGISPIALKGHSVNMMGYITADNVLFVADAVCDSTTLSKYKLTYLYDVEQYLATLDMLCDMKASYYLPSHSSLCEDIKPLVDLNRDMAHQIISDIYTILCANEHTIDELLIELCSLYELKITINQYALDSAIIRSYVSYLRKLGKIEPIIKNNLLTFRAVLQN